MLNKTDCIARATRRFGAMVLVAATALAGCNGFPDTVPFSEAEHMPEKYPSYALGAPSPVIAVGQQRFMVMPGAVVEVAPSALAPAQADLWAARTDNAPYDQLYQQSNDGKIRVAGEVR